MPIRPDADVVIEFPEVGTTYARNRYAVYKYSQYPRSSVLAGQERRQWLAAFDTLGEAVAAFPAANQALGLALSEEDF